MIIKILGSIPNRVTLACSGGPDSMAALNFLRAGRKEVKVVHFDHGTSHSSDARRLVTNYCKSHDIPFAIHYIKGKPSPGESVEAWWRERRYEVINKIEGVVVTGHNLNDVAEWWIFTALRGNPCLMPRSCKNTIKPFLLTEKSSMITWCRNKNVPFVIDPSNEHMRFSRNRIRQKILPEALMINPGLLTVMRKKLKLRQENHEYKN